MTVTTVVGTTTNVTNILRNSWAAHYHVRYRAINIALCITILCM